MACFIVFGFSVWLLLLRLQFWVGFVIAYLPGYGGFRLLLASLLVVSLLICVDGTVVIWFVLICCFGLVSLLDGLFGCITGFLLLRFGCLRFVRLMYCFRFVGL